MAPKPPPRGHLRPLLLATLLLLSACSAAPDAGDLPSLLRDGDIVFQTSRSDQSALIRLATGSEHTHVGLVFLRDAMPIAS